MAYVVLATWTAKDGEQNAVADLIKTMVPLSRAEPGNLRYDAQVSADDPHVFVIYEQYADEDAFSAHRNSEHFQQYVVGDVLARLESRTVRFFDPLEP